MSHTLKRNLTCFGSERKKNTKLKIYISWLFHGKKIIKFEMFIQIWFVHGFM